MSWQYLIFGTLHTRNGSALVDDIFISMTLFASFVVKHACDWDDNISEEGVDVDNEDGVAPADSFDVQMNVVGPLLGIDCSV